MQSDSGRHGAGAPSALPRTHSAPLLDSIGSGRGAPGRDAELENGGLLTERSGLLRATSLTLTGGAALLPEAQPLPEGTPLRTPTRRTAQERVHQRMLEELRRISNRPILVCGVLLFLVVVALGLIAAVLFIRALYALIVYGQLPCDQPLKYYLCVSVAVAYIWGQISSAIQRYTRNFWLRSGLGPLRLCFVIPATGLPSWLTIGWGYYMIDQSKTCQKTNPGLYYPTMYYIYGQILTILLSISAFVVLVLGLRRVLVILNTLNVSPGCREAVRKLPKIPPDSKELIDAEDGQPMDCPICMEPLPHVNAGKPVRAPCSHHFHEECLATWCQNHVDCPLCRQQIGEIDGEGGRMAEV